MSKIEIIYLAPKEPKTVYLKNEGPTVFEVLEECIHKSVDLDPSVKVHDETKKEEKKPKEQKTHHKKHFKPTRILTFFIAIFVVGMLVFNMGYLPIKAFLQTPEPIGCAGEIEIESFIQQYPALEEIPNLDKIKCKVYLSDASTSSVGENFKYQLKKDGYTLDYEGVITKKGITFHYYGFTKGITAIGILLTDDINQVFNHETAVLSTIGSIYDYQELSQWYKTKL